MTIYLLALTIILIALNLIFTKQKRTHAFILQTILKYVLFVYIGLGGIMAFMSHAFMPDKIAPLIGWTPSQFETEIAVANLTIGVLGILCLWIKKEFWLATVIAYTVFMFGCMGVHIQDKIVNNNLAPLNYGPAIWFSDVVLPSIIVILYIWYAVVNKKNK